MSSVVGGRNLVALRRLDTARRTLSLMHSIWPSDFARVPDEPWVHQPVDELAVGYDSVENHGWYANLDSTVEDVAAFASAGSVILDYSGGTGILADRLLSQVDASTGILIVDSSPKFLRFAVEKLGDSPRVAFRRIRYLRDEKRLERVDEVLGPGLMERGVDAVVSTNAIHLYYDLAETARAWRNVMRPSGRLFVQSGNIRHPDMPADEWIIDETVHVIHRAAVDLVRTDERLRRHRDRLDDEAYMSAHAELRSKYFLPVRPLAFYVDKLRESGFEVESVRRRRIAADVMEWFDFLRVYHEGVLGWIGGAERITGAPATPEAVEARLDVMLRAMRSVFGGADEFGASWTYVTCTPVTGGSESPG